MALSPSIYLRGLEQRAAEHERQRERERVDYEGRHTGYSAMAQVQKDLASAEGTRLENMLKRAEAEGKMAYQKGEATPEFTDEALTRRAKEAYESLGMEEQAARAKSAAEESKFRGRESYKSTLSREEEDIKAGVRMGTDIRKAGTDALKDKRRHEYRMDEIGKAARGRAGAGGKDPLATAPWIVKEIGKALNRAQAKYQGLGQSSQAAIPEQATMRLLGEAMRATSGGNRDWDSALSNFFKSREVEELMGQMTQASEEGLYSDLVQIFSQVNSSGGLGTTAVPGRQQGSAASSEGTKTPLPGPVDYNSADQEDESYANDLALIKGMK